MEFGSYPSLVEVVVFVVGYVPYPSSVEVDCGCLAKGLPLLCEVVIICLGGGCIV